MCFCAETALISDLERVLRLLDLMALVEDETHAEYGDVIAYEYY